MTMNKEAQTMVKRSASQEKSRGKLTLNRKTVKDLTVNDAAGKAVRAGNVKQTEYEGRLWVC